MARSTGKFEFNGTTFRSKFERTLAEDLTERGIEFEYEPYELEYYLKLTNVVCDECGGKDCYQRKWYTPDFFLPDSGITIEAKGMFTAENRKKSLAIREYHEGIDLRFVFMANNKLHRKSQIRYDDWCKRYDFRYAFKVVPREWL